MRLIYTCLLLSFWYSLQDENLTSRRFQCQIGAITHSLSLQLLKKKLKNFSTHEKEEDDEGWTFFSFFVPEDWDEDNWYWSRVEAWGTKWDASIIDVNWVSDTDVCLTFDTAWGPPIGVYEAAVEQGWECTLPIMSQAWVLSVAS